jgi:hypothetical protein
MHSVGVCSVCWRAFAYGIARFSLVSTTTVGKGRTKGEGSGGW